MPYTDADDGSFFMSFDDFLVQFANVDFAWNFAERPMDQSRVFTHPTIFLEITLDEDIDTTHE